MGPDCLCVDVTLMCILPSCQRLQGAQVRKLGPEPTEVVPWTWHSSRRNLRTGNAPVWRAPRIRMVGARAASLQIFRQRMAEYSQFGNGSRLLTHRYGIDGHFVELTAPTGASFHKRVPCAYLTPFFGLAQRLRGIFVWPVHAHSERRSSGQLVRAAGSNTLHQWMVECPLIAD